MKKILLLVFGLMFIYSCSTSSDSPDSTPLPVPPSNLTGNSVSTTQINLLWTDNSTNETGFKIERKTGTGTYAVVGTTSTEVITFNDNELTPTTSYTYRVYSYNSGGNSPTYSNEITLTTQTPIANLPSVTIGSQIWQNTNLDVITYRDGTPIPEVTDPTQWKNLTTGAWCYYNNDPANGAIYGKLYNWFAVAGIHDTDPITPNKILAPMGWHIPSYNEWTTLGTFLGGLSIAGGKMKSTGTSLWQSPNTGATNESGFNGFPGGSRSGNFSTGGLFSLIGSCGFWWSSTLNSNQAWYTGLYNDFAHTGLNDILQPFGLSVRCIKD
jgi:uncharacterized protein (TIGR02145 family)